MMGKKGQNEVEMLKKGQISLTFIGQHKKCRFYKTIRGSKNTIYLFLQKRHHGWYVENELYTEKTERPVRRPLQWSREEMVVVWTRVIVEIEVNRFCMYFEVVLV